MLNQRYPLPVSYILEVLFSGLTHRKRSLHLDASNLVSRPKFRLRVIHSERSQSPGRYLYCINHFSAPGFSAMWIAIALSATIPQQIHWSMTNAWTFLGHPLRRILRTLSERILATIAEVYDFTLMPPMPKEEADSLNRSLALRELFKLARANPDMSFAFAPEGRDFARGVLGEPAEGFGRFIYEFSNLGFLVLPVGIFEEKDTLILKIGEPFALKIERNIEKHQLDEKINLKIMTAIARLLPSHLRGKYEFTGGE